jgi:hypothetical protein
LGMPVFWCRWTESISLLIQSGRIGINLSLAKVVDIDVLRFNGLGRRGLPNRPVRLLRSLQLTSSSSASIRSLLRRKC